MTNVTRKANQSVEERTLATAGRECGMALALSAVAVLTVGCRSDMAAIQQAPIVDGNSTGNPANANMAAPVATGGIRPVYDPAQAARNGYAPRPAQGTRVAGESYNAATQSYAETYPAQDRRQTRSEAYNYNTQPQVYDQNTANQANGDDDQIYGELLDNSVPVVPQPPPPLPTYEQPLAPGADYLWTPGYWNYANAGYFYVPGNWVSAPFAGALWTPGWWGYTGRGYGWHHGYWGRHVGYYGGVNYGFGFIGVGYQGGYWNNDHFQYNRDCNHVDPRTVNNFVYQRNISVANNSDFNHTRVSYYGGPGGLQRRPLPAEFAAQRETHLPPLAAQTAERQTAAENRQQFLTSNHGSPQQLVAAHPVMERNVNVPAHLRQPQQSNRGSGTDAQTFSGNNGRFNGNPGSIKNGPRGNMSQAAVPPQLASRSASQPLQQAEQQGQGQADTAPSQQQGQARQQANAQQQRQQQDASRLQQQSAVSQQQLQRESERGQATHMQQNQPPMQQGQTQPRVPRDQQVTPRFQQQSALPQQARPQSVQPQVQRVPQDSIRQQQHIEQPQRVQQQPQPPQQAAPRSVAPERQDNGHEHGR